MMKIFALNTSLDFFEAYPSEKDAISNCPGLEIAEGDWLFFDDQGAPLEAHFSEPVRINVARGIFGNGVYTLRKASGKTLIQCLFELSEQRGAIWFGTFERLQAYFGDAPSD